jgi:BMFP domain-containing protein YqiC
MVENDGNGRVVAASWHGAFVVGMATAGSDVDQAAHRLIDEGLSAKEVLEIEEFVRELDLDPSTRDRTRLLVERTRMLVERATAGAASSDESRAQQRTGPSDGAPVGDLASLWRHELATPLAVAN